MKPIDGLQPAPSSSVVQRPASKVAPGFRDMVGQAGQTVNFSRHAAQRMQEREIQLSPKEMNMLNQAMGEARTAGAKQAAVVMDPGIFIVAPHSNTVITTMPKNAEQPLQLISHVDALVLVGRTSSEGASSPRPTDGGQPAVHWSLIQNPDS